MAIKYEEYLLIEFFGSEPEVTANNPEAYSFHVTDKEGFTLTLYFSVNEHNAAVRLEHKDFENPVYNITVNNVREIKVEPEETMKSPEKFSIFKQDEQNPIIQVTLTPSINLRLKYHIKHEKNMIKDFTYYDESNLSELFGNQLHSPHDNCEGCKAEGLFTYTTTDVSKLELGLSMAAYKNECSVWLSYPNSLLPLFEAELEKVEKVIGENNFLKIQAADIKNIGIAFKPNFSLKILDL